jgi:transcriptional regulator with XRE-family HTH domain
MSEKSTVVGQDWLKSRMSELKLGSISDLEQATGINRGTLSRYFRQIQRPSIDVIPVLCEALEVSPETLLRALGVTVPRQS